MPFAQCSHHRAGIADHELACEAVAGWAGFRGPVSQAGTGRRTAHLRSRGSTTTNRRHLPQPLAARRELEAYHGAREFAAECPSLAAVVGQTCDPAAAAGMADVREARVIHGEDLASLELRAGMPAARFLRSQSFGRRARSLVGRVGLEPTTQGL